MTYSGHKLKFGKKNLKNIMESIDMVVETELDKKKNKMKVQTQNKYENSSIQTKNIKKPPSKKKKQKSK